MVSAGVNVQAGSVDNIPKDELSPWNGPRSHKLLVGCGHEPVPAVCIVSTGRPMTPFRHVVLHVPDGTRVSGDPSSILQSDQVGTRFRPAAA
jgi:hypothetical protein